MGNSIRMSRGYSAEGKCFSTWGAGGGGEGEGYNFLTVKS